MTKETKRPKAGATELCEEEIGLVNGGYANLEVSHLKGKKSPTATTQDIANGDLGSGRVK